MKNVLEKIDLINLAFYIKVWNTESFSGFYLM